MGEVSIIGRRLEDGHVQYGWAGNGGTFLYLGARLLHWYDDPEKVEYLFSLGQLRHLYEPHSEDKDCFARTIPTGQLHWLGITEREIFSRIAYVDFGYFYDSDRKWYYVLPGPFRVKIPLELMSNCVDREGRGFVEGDFLKDLDERIIRRIMAWYEEDEDFREYLTAKGYDREKFAQGMEAVLRRGDACDFLQARVNYLWDHYRDTFEYFDDWVLVQSNEDNTEIRDIRIRKKETEHVETIDWGEQSD